VPKVVILVEPSSLISQAEEKSCPANKENELIKENCGKILNEWHFSDLM
jgi:hypothetical protein